MKIRTTAAVLVAALAPVAAAQDHGHITVDTASGAPGEQIIISTYTTETNFSIVGGVLHRAGVPAVFDLTDWQPSGSFQSWFLGQTMTLTADFFAATGRLDGGNFAFEITGFTPEGGSDPATLALVRSTGGTLVPFAFSDGATRLDRSWVIGFNTHPHGQRAVVDGQGLFRVDLVAWDTNGVYTDSAPVSFYVQTPAPGALASFGGALALASRRRRR
jgi:hypothetical protein